MDHKFKCKMYNYETFLDNRRKLWGLRLGEEFLEKRPKE